MKNLTNVAASFFLLRAWSWVFVFTTFAPLRFAAQQVDPTWPTNPIIHAISTDDDVFYDLKLDNAGKIVTVGWTPDDDEGFSQRIVVTRRLPDGSLDPTFDGTNNGNGVVYIDQPALWNKAYALEIQADNKIVIAGENNSNPLVFRLNENGILDNTFSTDGIAEVSVTGTFYDLVIQPDGKITAVGVVYTGITNNSQDYLLARFLTNGQLDNQLDFDGKATYTIFDDDYPAATSIQLQPDGKYVIVGSGNRDGTTTDDITLARVLPNGQLDPNFAFNGYWYSSVIGNDYGNDVLVLPNGKILTCGIGRFSSDDVIQLILFSSAGTLENSWIYYPLEDDYDYGYSLSLQCDGKILVVGQSNSQTVIIRLNADMSLDQTWGPNGYVFLEVGYIDYPRVVRAYGDKVYVSGYIYNSGTSDYDPFILRLNNTSFGTTPTIIASSTTICPGTSVTLTASGCLTCQVVWYQNGAPTGQTTSQITVITAGTYTAAYQNGDCGTGSPSNTITINAGTSPNAASVSPAGPVTACTSQQLTAANICAGCTITWYKNNTLIPGQNNATLNATTSGVYHAIVSNGCPSQTSNQVTVNIVPPPTAATLTPSSPISICNGQAQTITANNVCSGCVVTWYQNGAPIAGQTGTSLQVSSPGSYTCTVSNGACNSPLSNQVIATTLPAATPPAVSTNATTTCTTATLTASNICSQCTVNWYNANDSLIGTGNTTQVPPGTYYARTKNLCPEESSQSNIVTIGQAQFNATISVNNCTLCVPAGSSYTWYLNNQIIPGATTSCWTATTSGNYFVSMTDLNGCMGVTPTVPVSCISTIQTIEGINNLRIFPNPANDQVTFELDTSLPLDLDIQLFAADGRRVGRVFQGLLPTNTSTIVYQVGHLPTGTYFYKIKTEKGIASGVLAVSR